MGPNRAKGKEPRNVWGMLFIRGNIWHINKLLFERDWARPVITARYWLQLRFWQPRVFWGMDGQCICLCHAQGNTHIADISAFWVELDQQADSIVLPALTRIIQHKKVYVHQLPHQRLCSPHSYAETSSSDYCPCNNKRFLLLWGRSDRWVWERTESWSSGGRSEWEVGGELLAGKEQLGSGVGRVGLCEDR